MFEDDLPKEDTMLLELVGIPQSVLVNCRDIIKLRSWKNSWTFCDGVIYTTINRIPVNLSNFILDNIKRRKMFDHRNRNNFDFTRKNLREASREENAQNRGKIKNSSSKFKGVSWNKESKKWIVRIMVSRKPIYIGRFNTELEAAISYDAAAIKYFGEFACTNKMLGLL